ncbi:nucleoside phosphorylase [uncultured Polaribacter sp.]|uniref:nucleoside phosphorylase n=1 Tax=uncultured Polaribacter sp. TaxID=174711 RepID=UPI002612510F|nr:nucleoside phosphorylase [uncultured Polaribacter sp.]
MSLKQSELILNENGSVYHLNLLPENIAEDIIFVGDQERVATVTDYFETIEFTTQKREFKTTTGRYKGKRLTVISTGIGPDNIDIVLNELDALVNIDLPTRTIKTKLTQLNIVRIGTSGALQKNIPVDSFLLSSYGLDLNGMLHAYKIEPIVHKAIEDAFIKHTNWNANKARPILVKNSSTLENKLKSKNTFIGITATAGGFYGPQGRVLRLALADESLNHKIDSFHFNNHVICNLEMETSAIYGLSKLLGHKACSMNAILANRATGTFSKNPKKIVQELILYTLNKLAK